MSGKVRLPSPALAVATCALFVALGGTAVAAGVVPLATRALTSDNAKKVGGKTSAQVVQQAAAQPGPASTAAGLFATKTINGSLAADHGQEFVIACDAGKVIGAGWSTSGSVVAWDSRPISETTWSVYLGNVSSSSGANVTVYAICVR
jgi:hypothetical protein